MEIDKKLEKRKNLEIVVLSIIIVALLGVLIYLLFIKKDDKSTESSKSQDNQQTEITPNNNQLTDNDSQPKTKSLIEGVPSGYDKNASKQIVKPIRQLKYDEKSKETIKIDDNLTIVFYKEEDDPEQGYYSSFDLVYKGKTLVTDKNEKVYQLGFSTEKEPFEVYKLGEKYLIKAYYNLGQCDLDWLFYIHEDGSLERFEREDGALSPGTLSKIEYVTINNKSYYLLTIIGFSEGVGPEDYDDTEFYNYYYLNAN